MGDRLSICALPSDLHVPEYAAKRYQRHSVLIVMTFACAVALKAILTTIYYSSAHTARRSIPAPVPTPLRQVDTAM
jgi:hypothetical protein